MNIASGALEMPIDPDGILDVIESQVDGKQDYIEFISHTTPNERGREYYYRNNLPSRDRHLKQLAERFPAVYKRQNGIKEKSRSCRDDAENPHRKLTIPTRKGGCIHLAGKTKQHYCGCPVRGQPQPQAQEISDFLYGKTSTADFLAQTAPNLAEMRIWGGTSVNYISAYGIDEFAGVAFAFSVCSMREALSDWQSSGI